MEYLGNFTTTQGVDFNISIIGNEIVFTDEYEMQYHWDNSSYNRKLVDAMTLELTTRILG